MLRHWMSLLYLGPDMAALYGFLLIFAVSFVPVIPIPAIAVALGSLLPFWIAMLVAWASASFAAVLKFLLFKWFLRSWSAKILKKYSYSAWFLRFMEQHGFVAVLIARVIPFIPSSVINVGAGATGMPFWSFCWATLIGKVPGMFAFVLAGSELRHRVWASVIIVVAYLAVIYIAWRYIRKRMTTESSPS